VVVEGMRLRPLVVGLPGIGGTLKENVRGAIVADNKNAVALIAVLRSGEFRKIHAAWPVLRHFQTDARFPRTFAQSLLTNLRSHLQLAVERPERLHEPRSSAAVVAHAVDINRERACRIGADAKIDLLTCRDTRSRAVAFDE